MGCGIVARSDRPGPGVVYAFHWATLLLPKAGIGRARWFGRFIWVLPPPSPSAKSVALPAVYTVRLCDKW